MSRSKGRSRALDGIVVLHGEPSHARFNTFTDSTEFTTIIHGPGEYIVNYIVCSGNFPPMEGDFLLHLGDSLDDIIFEVLQ